MFHKLESLWRIEYEVITREPLITQAASEDLKKEISGMIGKDVPKLDLDAVPLVIDNHAVITGNAVKGLFRHIISAQLTKAGREVCVQQVKVGRDGKIPEGRKEQCPPDNPCFVCKWFGTASRQGALHFSFLKSEKKINEGILIDEPIPMIAIRDDYKATAKGAFLLIAPIREGVKFEGWIKGENLKPEIIGAIKEIEEMSKKGFLQFGAFKTRGMGSVEMRITKIEEYQTVPFRLKNEYTGRELEKFLKDAQKMYHEILKS